MKRFLASISLSLLCLCAFCVPMQDDGQVAKYSLVVDARGTQTTSICVISRAADGTVLGTVVNEFGMKVFDFAYNGRKAKLTNVFKPLNKWYIKKVIRKDVTFLVQHADGKADVHTDKRTLTFTPEGGMTLVNKKYGMTYTFGLLEEQQ